MKGSAEDLGQKMDSGKTVLFGFCANGVHKLHPLLPFLTNRSLVAMNSLCKSALTAHGAREGREGVYGERVSNKNRNKKRK